MSKWNLFEIFSHLDVSELTMPKLRRKVRLSQKNVYAHVMHQLASEIEEVPTARPNWRLRRIPAIFTAAAILLSGTAFTVVATSGGFQELFHLVFGEDASYPDTLETLYTIPDVEITDTCDAIDCQVVGVIGDTHTVTIVLKFTGENGFTLPEYFSFTSDGFGTITNANGEGLSSYSGYTSFAQNYDPSDGGSSYHIIQITSSEEFDENFTFEFNSGYFMQAETNTNTLNYSNYYNMRAIRNWLGFTMAEINQRRPLTETEQQQIDENFVLLESNPYTVDNDESNIYVRKSDMLVEGSISLSFPLDYDYVEPVTDHFLYTDPETGDSITMNMVLSPYSVLFTWNLEEGIPKFLGAYYGSNVDHLSRVVDGYVQRKDGTTTPIPEGPITKSASVGMQNNMDPSISRQGTLVIFLEEVVDPKTVQTVYYQEGCPIWSSSENENVFP